MEIKSPLLSIIPTGRENAQTGREIAALMGWELRDVTKEICRLRRGGIPICAYTTEKPKGYALADGSTNELENYCKRFKGRLSEITKTYSALENYRKCKDPTGQGGACNADS